MLPCLDLASCQALGPWPLAPLAHISLPAMLVIVDSLVSFLFFSLVVTIVVCSECYLLAAAVWAWCH